MAATYDNVWKKHGCIIRQRGGSFQVERHHAGKRTRTSFLNLKEATEHARSLDEGIRQDGEAAFALRGEDRLLAIRLVESFPSEEARLAACALRDAFPTAAARADAIEAARLLRDHGATVPLADSAQFWVAHHPAPSKRLTVKEALSDYLGHKVARRARTLKQIEYQINHFLARQPEGLTVPDVTTDMVKAYLVAAYPRVRMQRKALGILATFFKFCCAAYRLPTNPAKNILLAVDAADETEVEAYTTEEARNILFHASAHPLAPKLVPVVALGFFAGLRPSEVQGLDWTDVSLAARRVRVSPETAKRRRSRYVDMPDCLAAWLEPYAQSSGAVAPAYMTYRRAREAVMEAAGCRFLMDGFRHTFGTMHLAAFENPAATALLMGHRANQDLVFTNYRKLVTREEAQAFWRILPPKQLAPPA